MGYLWLGMLALVALGLMQAMSIRGSLLTLAAAALAFGCAGYALQGRPGLPGQPRVAEGREPPVPLTKARQALMGQFDSADAWLNLSEGIASRGNTADAVGIMRSAVREHPHNYKLWVGLGNALTDHARMLTPAGRFAFERAAELAPGHPAPAFFLGLAEARSGNPEEAARLWRGVLANAPADVSWRPLVEDGLLLIGGSSPPGQGGDRGVGRTVGQQPAFGTR